MRVELSTDGRGRALTVKRADSRDEAARLRREADLLDVATHPGLVELVALVDDPEVALSTGHLEGGSLAEGRPLEVEELAGAVAAVAATLADLHELGLVHGAVAPEHVLLDGDGRPVLCSLGYGGLAGERRPTPPAVDAAFVDRSAELQADMLDTSLDVYAVGALLTSLLATANGRARGGAADALRRIADRCMSPARADRPSARQLADQIHDQVPGARLPGSRPVDGPTSPGPRPSRPGGQAPLESWRHAQVRAPRAPRRRGRRASALVVAAVAVLAGAVVLRSRPSVSSPQAEETPADASAPSTTLGPTSTEPVTTAEPVTTSAATTTPAPPARTTVVVRAGCAEVPGPLAADVDGDGCPDEVRFAGGVVEAAGRRWQVGDASDIVAVGDWSCSGTRALAVLRPSTGEVFAFAGWAAAGQPLDAPLVGRVAGARALRAADIDGDGCNELVVERSEGAPAVLRAPRAAK